MIEQSIINEYKAELDSHPIYTYISTPRDLQVFMQHHIYSVWDFMSLIKYLQSVVAPTIVPWVPTGNSDVKRLINELVLEEESDERPDGTHSSHVELYLEAMSEVGAAQDCFTAFLETLKNNDITTALQLDCIPEPSKVFTTKTFEVINSGKPHVAASYLGLGREHIIPTIFRALLKNIGITNTQAPIFHYYLNRHVHVDEDFHAPLSLKLIQKLCDTPEKEQEAITAARSAVNARIAFWDGVLDGLKQSR